MEDKQVESKHLCPTCDSPVAHPKATAAFQKELAHLINRHSMETGSATPDFLLASYLTDCLATWNKHQLLRDRWWTAAQPTGHEDGRRGE